jgi:ankyrin repeat protein
VKKKPVACYQQSRSLISVSASIFLIRKGGLVDTRFQPAIAAIMSGNIHELRELLKQDPSLATARSTCSHPTLLQCLAIDAMKVENQVEMAQVLIDAGAEINEPLVAAASIGNVPVISALLDAGGAIEGTGSWSPLEEAIYWCNEDAIKLLLERGARLKNLRIAAALGRIDLLPDFFNADGSLKPEAGKVAWPFGDQQDSKSKGKIREELQAKLRQWTNSPDEIIDNAFVYACMRNHVEAAEFLLQKGANINAIPNGFDYAGTGLHYAALNGHRVMVDFLLERGADPRIKDTKVGAPPSGWADYGGHPELRDYLDQKTAA